jgi:phage protein D
MRDDARHLKHIRKRKLRSWRKETYQNPNFKEKTEVKANEMGNMSIKPPQPLL